MDDNKDGKEILEVLKHTPSESFKSIQRKLTTARNTITGDALSYPYNAFFTDKEKKTLNEAAAILGGFKSKIEHAKEMKVREEKQRQALLDRCKAQRKKILDQCISSPTSITGHLEVVIFHLALLEFHQTISSVYFRHDYEYIESDLERGLGDKYSHLTVKSAAIKCWGESYEWLEDNLWRYDNEPEESRIEKVLKVYKDEWRSNILTRHEALLARYQEGLEAEFEHVEKKQRAVEAKQRRAGFKSVK